MKDLHASDHRIQVGKSKELEQNTRAEIDEPELKAEAERK